MGHRDEIVATIAFALSAAALAGVVATDEYSQAALAEARGYQALLHEVAGAGGRAFAAPALLTCAASAPQAVAQ